MSEAPRPSNPDYRVPPLEEAVFQVNFTEPQDPFWGPLLSSNARISEIFPQEPKAWVGVNLAEPPSGGEGVVGQGFPGLRFSNPESHTMFAICPSHVAFHAVAPYCGGSVFRKQVAAGLEVTRKAYPHAAIYGVSMKMIDRVRLPEDIVDPLEWIAPECRAGMVAGPSVHSSASGREYRDESGWEHRQTLAIDFAAAEIHVHHDVFVRVRDVGVGDSALLRLFDELKQLHRTLFEGKLSMVAKESFR